MNLQIQPKARGLILQFQLNMFYKRVQKGKAKKLKEQRRNQSVQIFRITLTSSLFTTFPVFLSSAWFVIVC